MHGSLLCLRFHMILTAAADAKAGRSAEPDGAQPGPPQRAAESEAPSEAPSEARSARPPLQPLTQSRQRGGSAALADRVQPGEQTPIPQHSGRDSRASSPSSHLRVPKRVPPQLKQSPGQLRTGPQPHERLSPEPSNAPAGLPRQPRGTAGSAAGSEPGLQHHGDSKQLSASTAANATARSRKSDAVVQDDASSPPAGQTLLRSAAEAARDAAAWEAPPPSRAAAQQADVPGVQVAEDDTSPAVTREVSFAVPIGCQRWVESQKCRGIVKCRVAKLPSDALLQIAEILKAAAERPANGVFPRRAVGDTCDALMHRNPVLRLWRWMHSARRKRQWRP